MRIPRIYQAAPLMTGATVTLDPQASNHVARVLRLKVGAALILFNGNGGEFAAQLMAVDKRGVVVSVGVRDLREAESPLPIHLGQGISRGEKMDVVVQKAVELGVTEITPLLTERVTVQLAPERLAKRWQHWQAVAISACEQCGRNRIPQINAPMPLAQWLALTANTNALRLVLHHRAEHALPQEATRPHSVNLLIGPEGGLSEQEIVQAEAQHYAPLSLGPRILRTETAPLVAIAVLQYRWGDI